MLEVENLRSAYGRIEVLKGVSLEVRAGEVVVSARADLESGAVRSADESHHRGDAGHVRFGQ